ncbi:MAG: hypothetical protein H7Y42_14325 [Chitinophagaceae bacterium]|nr:hypothetical protein [Chitinophagaceae bacterium]
MFKRSISRLIAIMFISLSCLLCRAQTSTSANAINKPYRILTSGKQVTVKSTKTIKNVMVWTATGHRIVEQKNVNAQSFSFNVNNISEKVFFVMIEYEGGKPFTEKIGVQ